MNLVRQTTMVAALTMVIGAHMVTPSIAETTTLRVVPFSDPQVLDPVVTTAGITKNYSYMVYDTLFAVDGDGEIQLQMLEDYTLSQDELVYTFTLRDGLLWHDGEPVLAEDAVASLIRWGARDSNGRNLFDRIDEIVALDDRSFEIRLNEPFGATIEILARTVSRIPFIMPRRVAETDPNTPIDEHIGSGPFRFVEEEWVPGNRVVFERNEDYLPRDEPPSGHAGGKVVNVDRVEWIIMPDQQTALAAILAGEVDIWEGVPTDLGPIIEAADGVDLQLIDQTGWIGYVAPNHRHPPFDTPQGREALAWVLNQEDILTAIAGDPSQFEVCHSMFACGTPMSTDINNEALAGVDGDRARSLLQEVGWDIDTPIVIMNPTDIAPSSAATLVFAEALRDAGIAVDVQAADWATVSARRRNTDAPEDGGWNMFVGFGSGGAYENPVFHSRFSASCEAPWWTGACDVELEQLRQDWALATDLDDRVRIASAYQERAFEISSPILPFGRWFQPIAIRSNVEGLLEVSAYMAFWNVSVD